MMEPLFEKIGTVVLGLAVLHTFLCSRFQHLANRFPALSAKRKLFLLLGEVEITFGLWAGVYLSLIALIGGNHIIQYVEKLDFTEPAFVLVVMCVAATRPVI